MSNIVAYALITITVIFISLLTVAIKDLFFGNKPEQKPIISKSSEEVVTNIKSNKYSNWALILGILCPFFSSTFVIPISAIVLGYLGTQEAAKSGGVGKGKSLAGLILGIVYIAVASYVTAR